MKKTRMEEKMRNFEDYSRKNDQNEGKDVEKMNENRGKETGSMKSEEELHDEIAKVAYQLWEQSGKVEGRDLENWNNAKKIVMDLHKDDMNSDAKKGKNEGGMKGEMGMMQKRNMRNFEGKHKGKFRE